jgi:hypothetical protein
MEESTFLPWSGGYKIVISLLVTSIRYSLLLLVSNAHVLESTSNDVMSNDLVLYILCISILSHNPVETGFYSNYVTVTPVANYFKDFFCCFGRWE